MVSGMVAWGFFYSLIYQKPQMLCDGSFNQVSLESTKQPLGIYQLHPLEALYTFVQADHKGLEYWEFPRAAQCVPVHCDQCEVPRVMTIL